MAVEIEKVSLDRQEKVFCRVNEYLAAVLSGDIQRMSEAFEAIKELQDDE
ncbi:MAG: hypothetical protein AB1403_00575 [Candidatus Riflebacteria bacterium]